VSESKDEILRDVQASTRITADLAARSVCDGVRIRRGILDSEAVRPELRKLLLKFQNGMGGSAVKELQTYLDEREEFYQHLDIDDEWFVLDADGKLLDLTGPGDARARFQPFVGQYLWDRDYFHGKGINLPPQRDRPRPAHVQPIGAFYQSIVYRSLASGDPWLVSFSVPVKDKTGKLLLGILAMSVPVAGFGELANTNKRLAIDAGASQWVTLVQAREVNDEPLQWGANVPNRGVILEHPGLLGAPSADSMGEVPLVRIDPAVLDRLLADRGSVDYRDPFGNDQPAYRGRYVVAVEPVIYRYRTEGDNRHKEVNTGWVVLAQEDYGKAIAPVETLRNRLILQDLTGLALIVGLVLASWLVVAVWRPSSFRETLSFGGLVVLLGLGIAVSLGTDLGWPARLLIFLAAALCGACWMVARRRAFR
jgi:hypothetical protein